MPEEDEEPNEEIEKLLDAFDEARNVAEDFYDLYTRDAVLHYLGFAHYEGDFDDQDEDD